MIDSLGAAMAEPIVAVAVANLVVNAVIGIAVIGLLAALLRRISGRTEERAEPAAPAQPIAPAPAPAPPVQLAGSHQAMIAAISAAIAEDLGTEISAIRILSVKKL